MRPFSVLKTPALVLTTALLATSAAADDGEIEFLFVQTADGLSVDPQASTLRLEGINPHTVYFSDRPDRIAGHMTLNAYMTTWTEAEDSFAEDPPNATLSVYQEGNAQSALVVLELLDATVEGADLIYGYKVLEGRLPEGGGMPALFIDTIGRPGGGVGAGFHGVGVGARGPGAAGWAGVAARDCVDGGCDD